MDKEAYWGKMMYAEERNAKSREKGAENGLTDEQADALESMARARHNMHTNIDSLVSSSENRDCERDLIRANAKLREAGLPTVSSIPLDEDDYINIDSFDIIMYDTDIAKEEYGMPDKYENEEAWQEWYDRMYGRLYDKWEAINDKIENYLGEIDEKYGTSYRPTGATRFSIVQETKETDIIKARAIADGTFMKAPNGEDTNLTEQQWLQVRTEAFKSWFGDWEKTARIEKLKKSIPIEIAFAREYELDRKSAKKWAMDNIRGEYTNKDTGDKIDVSRIGVDKVTSHGERDEAHLKSLISIPQIIEHSIFIDNLSNEKDNDKYDSYRYYVSGLNIDGENYTVKMVVGVKGDKKYYDHELTQIEKGRLTDSLNLIAKQVAANQSTLSEYKDSKLISLLQINSSKVIDENQEPLVVHHGTWVSRGENYDRWNPKKEAPFYQFSESDNGIHFGTEEQAEYIIAKKRKLFEEEQGDYTGFSHIYASFLNIKNMYRTYDAGLKWAAVISEAKNNGYDGLVYGNTHEGLYKKDSYVVFHPTQIKSATDNIGSFNIKNEDIRLMTNIKGMKEPNKAGQNMTNETLQKTIDLLKKTGFADVKTGEDFYIKLSEITGDERYWINQRAYSDESRWDNSGYSERNDGSKASVNAISAEEDGTFSAGSFVKKYGVSKTNFEILTALKLIKNTEWHHTGKSFKETEFYSWADSTKADGKVEYDINGQVVNDEDIDFTPLSEIYQEHKKELTKLAKEYTEKNWEYERRKEEKEIPTFEEYAQKIGMENSPLTEEEDKKRRDSHWYISDNLVDELSSYERRIRHEEVDEHYQKIRQERADIYIEANRERLLEEYNATYKDDMAYNAEIKAYNKGVEESNSLSNGKEKVLLRIAEIFGMNEDKAKLNVKIYSGIKQAAIRHKAREEWVESQEKELNKTIVKKDNELQAWLQKQVKEGKVTYQNRITRHPDNFIETKKEKYGKYGWYDASKTIGGQEYYSGYEFESEKLYKEYRRRFRAIIDIKVKTKDKILEEANVRFLVERNVQGLGSLQSSIGENAIFGTKTTLSQKIIPQIKEKVERKINDDDGIRFMIGKQMRTMYEAGIRKKNHNITEKDIKTSLDFLHSLENNKENAKAIKVAVKWLTDDTIRLPYAIDNVRKAIAVAEKNKIDPTQYSSPMDIINEFYKDVEYGEHIAPDTVEAFKNKRTVGRGKNEVTIYDIDDNRAGQEAVCKICHEHFGYSVENKDSKQPWCLASFTRQGKPTESAIKYWDKTYNSVGKKIAFKDGKPIAFMAHDREHNYDLWWNLKDDPSDNLPLPNGRYISPDGEIELRKYGEGENELFDEAVEYVADELSDYDVEKILGDLKEKIDDGVEDIEVSYLFYEAEERAVRRARNSFIETTRYAIDSGDYDKYLKGRIDEYKKKKHIGEDGEIDEDDLKDLKDELAEDIADNFEDYEGAEGIWDDIFREKYEEELYNEDYSLSQKVAMIEDHIRQYPMGSVSDDVQDKKIELRGDDLESDGLGDNYRYSRPNGTVLGFVKGNTIYLNPDEVSLNTPIHEFGHLWVSQIKKYFPDLWEKGKDLFLQSNYLRVVQEDPNYRHLDLDGQVDEAIGKGYR